MIERCPCNRCQTERLGGYYSELDLDAWRALICNSTGGDHDIVRVASWLFLGRVGSPPKADWIGERRAVLIGDAFAHGAVKYGSVGGWRNVPLDHHLQSAGGHFYAWLNDHASLDDESKLTHEAHFLARAVMIHELRGAEA